MDESVDRAVKQLELIAIKAMNSGYLDDAAKVMHIAEQIERVDKCSLSEEKEIESDGSLASSANVVELGAFRAKRRNTVSDAKPGPSKS